MRIVKYKTYWSYGSRGTKREAPLSEFVLDILYLMENTGVLPPYAVLNYVLSRGGDNGDMGPGTSWRPFHIREDEYQQVRAALLTINVEEAKSNHPYVRFEYIIEDTELDQIGDYNEWLHVSFQRHYRDKNR